MDDELFRKKVKKGLSFQKPSPIRDAFSRIGEFFSGKAAQAGKTANMSAGTQLSSEPSLFDRIRSIFFLKALLICIPVIVAGFFIYRLTVGSLPGVKHTTLVFAQWWEDQLEGDVLSSLAAEFEKANPNVTIVLEKKNWDEIRQSLDGDAGPDMFSIDPYAFYELDSSFRLLAITTTREGSANILPLISFINPLFYNIDLLRNAGFDRPPKNQTEFLSYVQRIKETGGGSIYGAGLALGGDPNGINRHLLSWIWASTNSPESVENFKFNSKEVIGALNFLNQLNRSLYPYPYYLSGDDLLKAFGEGKVAMMIASSADIKKIKATPINFGITTIPSPESYTKKPVFPLNEWYVALNGKTIHQGEALQFAAFLKEKSERLAIAAYAVPGNGSRDRVLSRDDPYYSKAFDMYEAGEMVRERYESPDISALNSIIHREVKFMFDGTRTPEQCAAAIQEGWEQLVRSREENNEELGMRNEE